MKLFFGKFVWFVGYTYTDARQFYNDNKEVPLTPRHSVKGDILYVLPAKWRIGLDYEYKSPQTLTNGFISKSQFTTGIVLERTIQNFVLFFNAENVTDVRQTRYGSIVSNPYRTPQYTEVYAPLDGFFLNFGFKIKVL
jgi:outer membrane receptor for ferrienterochelin and colicins